jgi:glycosyltransferase involved in cell wall biosynthesis
LAVNSLDARYGSTYRMRPLCELLRRAGHAVTYVEGRGHPIRRLVHAVACALGDYDVAFVQKFNPVTLPVMAAARVRGKPVIADWDDFDPGLQGTRAKRWLATLCEGIGPMLASAVTTHSEEIRRVAERRGRRVFLVPQGFEASAYRPDPSRRPEHRARFGFSAGDLVVGHLCTFTDGGTVDLGAVLDSWQRIEDARVRFFLVGGGPTGNRVHEELAARGLLGRVTLSGLLPHAEVPAALACMDAGVVCMTDTQANRARISFKVIEYLAMDVPVVGRLVGESERCFGPLIAGADAAELPAAILRTAVGPRRPTAALVAHLDWDRLAAALLESVSFALARERPAQPALLPEEDVSPGRDALP